MDRGDSHRPTGRRSTPPPPAITRAFEYPYDGARYKLGYVAANFYAVVDGESGRPVKRFPLRPEGWDQAWRQFAMLEPRAAADAAPSGAIPSPPEGAATGRLESVYSGARYTLDRIAANSFVVLDTASGRPDKRYPLTATGWRAAWKRFASLEPEAAAAYGAISEVPAEASAMVRAAGRIRASLGDRIDHLWQRFERWPERRRAVAWMLGWWILGPIAVWRSTLAPNRKIALTAALLAMLVLIGASIGQGSPFPGSLDEDDLRVAAQAREPETGEAEDATGGEEAVASPSTAPTADGGGGAKKKPPRALVSRVIDGDTIEVQFKGETIDVRLIGVDTPETVAPGQPVECFGKAASSFAENSMEGERVRLEFDVQRHDRFGRTLAYVWTGGELFNETLVAEGYAQVATFPPNVKYVDRFLAAQRVARQNDRGLWHACTEEEEQAPVATADCDPSYPDVCIPPPPPDLNCPEIDFTDFEVVGDDPHGFDGDGDGIGCES
jgi:micrococcal nuclease